MVFLCFLHSVPKYASVFPFGWSELRQKYFPPYKPFLSCIIMPYSVIVVQDIGTAQIGRSRHGGASRPTADYLAFQMVNRQIYTFLSKNHSCVLADCRMGRLDIRRSGGQGWAKRPSLRAAAKLPVAGLRRQTAGSGTAGLLRQSAIPAGSRGAVCTGDGACGIACPLWRSVRRTLREERTGPTNGRDTTAPLGW